MNEQAKKYLSALDRSKRTIETYRYALKHYFSISDNIDNESYEKFLISIKDYSPSTKTIMKTAVMGMFDFLDIEGLEKRRKLNRYLLKRDKRRIVNISEDDIEKTIKYCDTLIGDLAGLRDRAFVLMLTDSGFRISEICSLKRGDIDWRNQRVPVVGKGDKLALVHLSRRSLAALNEYLSKRQSMDGSSGRPINSLPLFIQHGNVSTVKGMTVDGMRKSIKSRMREAGVDTGNVRIHDFRHYFVTTIVRATGDINKAKNLARHESISVTERYAHLTDTEIDKIYEEVFNK